MIAAARRALLLALAACGVAFAQQSDYAADFDHLWETLDREYAYFGNRTVDWPAVRDTHRPRVAAAADGRAFVTALEAMLETLTDSHLHLRTNTPSSPLLVPSGLDLWAEWRGARAIVTHVRKGHAAQATGLRAGDEIIELNGIAIGERVRKRLPCCLKKLNHQVRGWALLVEIAGNRDADRVLKVRRSDGRNLEVRLERSFKPAPEEPVSWRMLPGKLGYIRVTSLGDTRTVERFDAALEALKGTQGLLLDLTETAAGGNTDVAEPILGRFFRAGAVYQTGQPRTGAHWRREVAPRGPWTYDGAVVVLVGRWTASMGEGMAIGFDGTGRGVVVGSPMAGLLGAVFTGTLPRSGIAFNYPAERLFHVDGTPRERFRPAPEPGLAALRHEISRRRP